MNRKNSPVAVISLLVLLTVAIFGFCYYFQLSQQLTTTNQLLISANENSNTASLPPISTPAGWYSWGTHHYPDYETSTVPNSATFGNQPINNTGNNTTTLISVNAINTGALTGGTDEQWIDTVLYPDYVQALEAPTSTMLWNVINGKLILEAITRTPANGYDLSDYVFDKGIVYSFDLSPSYINKNIASSPDGQILKTMVQNFAQSLSSTTTQ